MEQKTLNDICSRLGNLEGTITKGFEGVDDHFERLNSKIATHEKRINANESAIDKGKGMIKMATAIWVVISACIGFAISFLKRG